jgi:hypothetical protein
MRIGQVNLHLPPSTSMEEWKCGSLEVLRHNIQHEHKRLKEQESRLVQSRDYGDTSADIEMNSCADFFKRDGQLVFDGLLGNL